MFGDVPTFQRPVSILSTFLVRFRTKEDMGAQISWNESV